MVQRSDIVNKKHQRLLLVFNKLTRHTSIVLMYYCVVHWRRQRAPPASSFFHLSKSFSHLDNGQQSFNTKEIQDCPLQWNNSTPRHKSRLLQVTEVVHVHRKCDDWRQLVYYKPSSGCWNIRQTVSFVTIWHSTIYWQYNLLVGINFLVKSLIHHSIILFILEQNFACALSYDSLLYLSLPHTYLRFWHILCLLPPSDNRWGTCTVHRRRWRHRRNGSQIGNRLPKYVLRTPHFQH